MTQLLHGFGWICVAANVFFGHVALACVLAALLSLTD